MAKRQDYPEAVFEMYNELRRDAGSTKESIGRRLVAHFPDLFEGFRSRSVVDAVMRQGRDRDIDIEAGPIGGRPKLPAADTRWLDATPELVVPFNERVIVLSDLHFPQHSTEYLERVLEVIRAKEIQLVVFNGDELDNGHKGHGGRRSHWNPRFEDGVNAMRDFVTEVCKCPSVQKFIFLAGNHSDKVYRDSDREFEFDALMREHILPELPIPEYELTNRYYAIMEPQDPQPWPFTGPQNFPWIFSHQSNYSGLQLSVAKRTSDVEVGNFVAGHQHHLSVGKHPNGLWYLVDAGTGQDPRLPAYKEARHSTFPKWACGFATIIHGVPQVWDLHHSDAWWSEQLS